MGNKEHVLIIGGGIFGLSAAIVLGEKGYKVTLVEKRKDVMQEASLVNQNRIHYGYHYPRSKLTCEEALIGLKTFTDFYGDSIHKSFKKYYAISKKGSHVDAAGFARFCESMDLPLEEAWPEEGVLDKSMVEACWLTPEPIFDFHKLKQIIIYRIAQNKNIRVIRNTRPLNITEKNDEKLVTLTNGYDVRCNSIVNATYAGISDVANLFGSDRIKAKFELCAMPILEMETPLDPFGVTVMDGPFCSLIPKGLNKGQYILYHVTHSVLQTHMGYHSVNWSPIDGFVELDIMEHSKPFFPIIDSMKLRDVWITTRVVLPDQEMDDARPTLVLEHGNHIFSMFSGKLTTCIGAANDLLGKLEKI